MEILLFILITYSISNIISNEYIFSGVRSWSRKRSEIFYNLISCPTCNGFWFGFLLFALIAPFSLSGIFIIDMILGGLLTSGCNSIIESFKNNSFKYE